MKKLKGKTEGFYKSKSAVQKDVRRMDDIEIVTRIYEIIKLE
jgi:hypothetical protein